MISSTLEISILNAIAQAYNGAGGSASSNVVTFPNAGYLALFTVMPSRNADTGVLGGGTEVSGGGYQRVDLDGNPFGSHYFTSAPSWDNTNKCFVIQNSSAIQFPMATASWSTVVGFGIYDAATNGNLTMAGTLDASQAVAQDNAVAFAAGALKISLADVQPAASNT